MTHPDVLGAPYTAETITLPDDGEGAVVATLVHRPADPATTAGPPERPAVLHLHGFCDYFFQTAMADFYTRRGHDFYALDLRKYGRSLLDHQTPNFCLDLSEYDAEIEAAMDRIATCSPYGPPIVSGHSTGGLVAALWLDRQRVLGRVAASALVLNSAWLDLQGSLFARTAGTEAINRLGLRRPWAVIPRNVTGVYAESLHRDFRGEWDYDQTWKPAQSFPVRAGWLRAVRAGHRRLHRGLDVGVPVLSLCSSQSLVARAWSAQAATSDTILDVKQIARWSHQMGDRVTVLRIRDALHDVLCSRRDVREHAFFELDHWLSYALDEPISPRTPS